MIRKNWNKIEILSLPFDNLSFKECLETTFDLIENAGRQRGPRSIAVIDIGGVVSTLSISPTSQTFLKVIDSLWDADLVIAEGKGIGRLSRMLSAPLKDCKEEGSFLTEVLDACSKQKKSVFLLGGTKEVEEVRKKYPELVVAGSGSINEEKTDREVLKEINFSMGDLLVAILPEPEHWIRFQEIRSKIETPLSIVVSAMPRWISAKSSLRLKSIYICLYRLLKLTRVAFPLVLYHHYLHLLHQEDDLEKEPFAAKASLMQNPSLSICTIKLPQVFDKTALEKIDDLASQVLENQIVIFDFNDVNFIGPAALGFLLQFRSSAKKMNCDLNFIHIPSQIRTLLKLHRIWYLLKKHTYSSKEELMDIFKEKNKKAKAIATIDTSPHYVYVKLFGQLDAELDLDDLLLQLLKSLNDKNCVIDLTGCNFIDSSGICFLLKLRKHMMEKESSLILSGLSSTLNQILQIAKVKELFTIRMDPKISMQLADKEVHKKVLVNRG